MTYLVLTKNAPGISWKGCEAVMREEAEAAWALHKAGVIRSAWFTAKSRDAVLLLEAADEEEAERAVMSLPLVREGLILYELLELRAYDGYERLFAKG